MMTMMLRMMMLMMIGGGAGDGTTADDADDGCASDECEVGHSCAADDSTGDVGDG